MIKDKIKRILVIMPSIAIQGMERSNLQIMKILKENGFDIHFITNKEYGEVLKDEIAYIKCHTHDVKFSRRLEITINPLKLLFILFSWVKSSLQIYNIYRKVKPDYIHITNIYYYYYCFPFLLLSNPKIVFRLPNPPNMENSGLKRILNDILWKIIIKRNTDIIICNSMYSLNILKATLKDFKNKYLIYNCLSERKHSLKPDTPKLNSESFNVLYLGRITISKGVNQLYDAAIRIIDEYDDVKIYFIGENSWKNPFAESLINDVNDRMLEDKIIFIDQIKDVFTLLDSSDLHVCPSISKHESFPNVILEAKYHSLPSVVFPTAGLPEAVEHLKDGYICSEISAESLYNGIKYFLDNQDMLHDMGKNAKKSLEKFSQEKAEKQWLEIYQ